MKRVPQGTRGERSQWSHLRLLEDLSDPGGLLLVQKRRFSGPRCSKGGVIATSSNDQVTISNDQVTANRGQLVDNLSVRGAYDALPCNTSDDRLQERATWRSTEAMNKLTSEIRTGNEVEVVNLPDSRTCDTRMRTRLTLTMSPASIARLIPNQPRQRNSSASSADSKASTRGGRQQ